MAQSFRNVAPTAIISDALRAFEREGQAEAVSLPPFIPSPGFQGTRPGYYYSRGPQGLGYYLDSQQPPPVAGSEAEAGDAEGEEEAGPSSRRPARQLDPEELLREAEEAAGDTGIELLDSRGLKRLLLALERKSTHNMEMRMKYTDQPDRFLESEVELDEAIKSLLVVASSPELYPELARSSAIPTLLSLLNHENSDIAAGVIELFSELTDADAVEDAAEEAVLLVDGLLEHNLLELLVHRLAAFDELVGEEEAAVGHGLSIVENLVDVKPEVAEMLVEKTKLLPWLLARLRPCAMDGNKQYASEILAILAQQSDANKRRMGEGEGIDIVLQAIAPYRNRDAETSEEEELVENLFGTLCSCLMLPENKRAFVESEGIELMLLVLKGRRAHRTAALKVLDFATTRCPPACERLVDQQGLKTLFAIFMGKLKVKKQDAAAAQEEEERAVSIIANLLEGLEGTPAKRDRVAAKFVEAEFEKCDRLLEVYFRYAARVSAGEQRLAEDAGEDLDEDELLLASMDAGLYTLQQCALVVGALWLLGDVGVRKRVVQLLHQKGHTLGLLREVLLEVRANVGEDGSQEERQKQIGRVSKMLVVLGHQADDGEEEALRQQASAAADGKHLPPPPARAVPAAAANGKGVEADEDGDVEMDVEDELAEAAAADPLPPERAAPGEDVGGGREQQRQAERREEGEEEEEVGRREERKRERGEKGREAGGRSREKRRRSEGEDEEGDAGASRRRRERRSSRSRDRDRERRRSRSRERDRPRDRERRRSRSRERRGSRERRERRRSRSRSKEREKEKDRR